MDILTIKLLLITIFISNLIVDLEINKLDFKPFNCTKCLGFWIGLLTFTFLSFNCIFIAISAYLINKIISAFI